MSIKPKSRKQYRQDWYVKNKEQEDKRSKAYYARNKASILAHVRKKNQAIKLVVLTHYSGVGYPSCNCCKESIMDFLTIDHINGGGTKHRKLTGVGTQMYRWLIKNNYPEGFQVLCFNCNCAKGLNGNNNKCPHEVTE